MRVSFDEKVRRKKAVDFVVANSRLEGLENHHLVEHLYKQYIEGQIDAEQLVKLTQKFMDERLKSNVS